MSNDKPLQENDELLQETEELKDEYEPTNTKHTNTEQSNTQIQKIHPNTSTMVCLNLGENTNIELPLPLNADLVKDILKMKFETDSKVHIMREKHKTDKEMEEMKEKHAKDMEEIKHKHKLEEVEQLKNNELEKKKEDNTFKLAQAKEMGDIQKKKMESDTKFYKYGGWVIGGVMGSGVSYIVLNQAIKKTNNYFNNKLGHKINMDHKSFEHQRDMDYENIQLQRYKAQLRHEQAMYDKQQEAAAANESVVETVVKTVVMAPLQIASDFIGSLFGN